MGDRKQIESLFKTHYAAMHRTALMLLHDEEAARDAVHDVFASVLNSDSENTLTTTYLQRAVKNRCLNHMRDLDIHQRAMGRYRLDLQEIDDDEWPDTETLSWLQSIIRTDLTEQGKRAIKLRFVKGLKFSEVARQMGMSENAVYKHMRQALLTLRNKLKDNGEGQHKH